MLYETLKAELMLSAYQGKNDQQAAGLVANWLPLASRGQNVLRDLGVRRAIHYPLQMGRV